VCWMSGLKMGAILGDIYEFDVDAIVCGANADLRMDGGIAAEIKEAGGQEIEDEAVAQAPAETGTAVITGAGSLKAKNVIHAVVGVRGEKVSLDDIEKSVKSSIAMAEKLGCRKMAIPAVGTAMANAPAGEVVELIVKLVGAHEHENLEEVFFIVCQRDPYILFKRELKKAGRKSTRINV